MADINRIRANVGSMIDQGAPEADIETYLASENVKAEDLHAPRMSKDDDRAYAALAANPKSTAADLKSFVRQRGLTLRDEDVAAFIDARDTKHSKVAHRVRYEGLPEAPPPGALTNSIATITQAVDGLVPGASRNLWGAMSTASNAANAAVGKEKFDPGAAFAEGEEDRDILGETFAAEHPNISAASKGVGMAGSLLLPQAKLFQGSKVLAGMGNAALNGAGYGALSGALNDTGDGRLSNAALGGAFGGVLGGGAVPALHSAAAFIPAARRNIPGLDTAARVLGNIPKRLTGRPLEQPGQAARTQAERILAKELPQSNIATGMGSGSVPATPANIQAEVARRQALGVPAMPMDVSEKGRRVTSWALQGAGPATTRVREMLMARQAGMGGRVRDHIQAELGPAVDPVAAVEGINARAAAASAPGYREAYAQPVKITDRMASIMQTPAFKEAVPQAVRNILNAQRDPHALGFRLHGDGSVMAGETLSTEGFDQVIRAMQDNARSAMDTSGMFPRNTTNSVHINNRARDLRGQLAEHNEPYRDVTANYANEMAIRDALEAGQGVANLSGHEIAGQMRHMPPHAQEAWMTGARTALADDAAQAGLRPGTNVAQRTRQSLGLSGAGQAAAYGDLGKQHALEAMSGNPGVISRLDDRLEGEDQAYKSFAETFGNSKTASRQALDRSLSGSSLGPVARVVRGDLAGALVDVLFHGNPKGTLRFKQDVQDHVADIMSSSDPRSMGEAMSSIIERAQRDARFAHVLNRAAINPSKLIALHAAALDADPLVRNDDGDLVQPGPLPLPEYLSGQ
ncbi:hypothetical protein PX554_13915 [Sphingomonas sp. H39-1-10]|uniref:hypothetical protein n=1 Tax=Sphingomonas pollutisoli TaxID=3030829 RepID=UPI0023B9532F|nr:hypothetical protein [Sphingomonas pollutisoli]MDF0489233.1 hypothetical protein [Sphingomonas pollutisoli]